MSLINYRMNEGMLPLPAEWRDESMHVFVLPDESGVNLVINRMPVPEGMLPDNYYAQTLTQFEQSLPGYKEVARDRLEVDGQPAQSLEYHWQSPEGAMHQYVVMQVRKQQLLTFTVTSPSTLTETQQNYFKLIIQGFKAV